MLRLLPILLVIFFPSPVKSHDGGPLARAEALAHNDNGGIHWYPQECCNRYDCAPIQAELIDGVWHWKSWRMHDTVLSISADDERIQQSQDGQTHACERLIHYEGEEHIICFFAPGFF